MPIPIPVYQPQVGPSAAPQVLQRDRVTAQDFGAGIADAAAGVAQAGIKQWKRIEGEELKKKRDTTLNEGYALITDAEQKLRSSLESVRGKGAMQAGAGARENFKTLYNNILFDMGDMDDETREALDRRFVAQAQGLARFADTHGLKESDAVHRNAASQAMVVSVSRGAQAVADGDEDIAELHHASGLKAVQELAAAQGQDPAAAVFAFNSEFHARAVQDLLGVNKVQEAADYMAEHGGDIESTTSSKLGRITDGALVQRAATSLADTHWAASKKAKAKDGRLLTPEGDVNVAIAAIETSDASPAEKAAAIAMVPEMQKAEYKIGKAADKPFLAQLALDHFENPTNHGLKSENFESMTRIGRAEWVSKLLRFARETRAEQDTAIARALLDFENRPRVGRPGEDQLSVDIEDQYGWLPKHGRDKLGKSQGAVARGVQHDGGVSSANFQRTLNADKVTLKGTLGSVERNHYTAAMDRAFSAYQSSPAAVTHPDPPPELVNQWRFTFLMEMEHKTSVALFVLGEGKDITGSKASELVGGPDELMEALVKGDTFSIDKDMKKNVETAKAIGIPADEIRAILYRIAGGAPEGRKPLGDTGEAKIKVKYMLPNGEWDTGTVTSAGLARFLSEKHRAQRVRPEKDE